MEELLTKTVTIIMIIIFGAIFGLLLAFPIMWCWNFAIVSTFGLPVITWGKAWCLNFLCGFFFKSYLVQVK